ncbi:helix-turn-helix domain-containing protein [uncultured Pseudokineococcus sp.]|uniref:helix-turn-helix domain-containing protein n=1 Tax=uncultured Pseudokineococcus sp. TaxID=1642928 RepID=UPI002629FAE0|nr:helix-turn-helix domain-containing protein [uncultured Pseudokineococcus sp.]
MTKVLGVDVGRVGELGGAVGDLGGFLREQRESAQMSLRQLAAAAGVSNPYLSQVERGLRRPSAEVLQQIARGLRISAEALYVRAGILEERPGDGGEVRAAVLADPYLSERQREVVLEIYTTFRAENARSEVPPTAPSPAADAPGGERPSAPAGAADESGAPGDEPAPPRRRTPRRTAPRATGTAPRPSDDHAPEGGAAGGADEDGAASGPDDSEAGRRAPAPAPAPAPGRARSARSRRPGAAARGEEPPAEQALAPRAATEEAATGAPTEPSPEDVGAPRAPSAPPQVPSQDPRST